MHDMQPPDVLDPDRVNGGIVLTEHDAQNHLPALEQAFRESCTYAQRLWADLNEMRRYLLATLPEIAGTSAPSGASSAPPAREAGEDRWLAAYSTITSTLCGRADHGSYGGPDGMGSGNYYQAPGPVGSAPRDASMCPAGPERGGHL